MFKRMLQSPLESVVQQVLVEQLCYSFVLQYITRNVHHQFSTGHKYNGKNIAH